jgi:hypothetical protein
MKDEEDNLAYVLANPGHPKTKRYMQDYQNALIKELIFEIEIINFLNHQHFISIKAKSHLIKAIQEQADERYHSHQLTMLRNNTPTLPMHEQRLYLQEKIATLQKTQTKLVAAIEEQQQKITAIDQGWKLRQEKFQDNLIKKLKDNKIIVRDLNDNIITPDELAARMKAAPARPSIGEVITQADVAQQMLLIAVPNGKPDPIVMKQIALKDAVQGGIKDTISLLPKREGENLKPSEVKLLMKANLGLYEVRDGLIKEDLQANTDDISNIMVCSYQKEDLQKNLNKSEIEKQATQTILTRLDNFVEKTKTDEPTLTNKSNSPKFNP